MIKTVEESEPSHRARYEWVRDKLSPTSSVVVDVGCGCGYGTFILAERAAMAIGVDIDDDAIEWAQEYFSHSANGFWSGYAIDYLSQRALPGFGTIEFTDAVAFEVLEHMPEEDARLLLKGLHDCASIERLYASTPNEETYPFASTRPLGHVKHYRPGEFIRMLDANGWRVVNLFTQRKKSSEIMAGGNGRYLLVECQRR